MQRSLLAVLTLAVVALTPMLRVDARSVVRNGPQTAVEATFPAPSEAERRDSRREFLDDALRTLSDRSGQVFFLPRKYNYVTRYAEAAVPTHVRRGGKVVELRTPGIAHGAPWDYDRDIPLVLWGPGFIKPGQEVRARASQQDLASTYAALMGAPLPSDARGRALTEAFVPTQRKPRVILTMVFDQGGERLYRLNPGATPFVDRLKREGTYFSNTRVSHLDLETGMGHVAIGTGAYPAQHGLPSNEFWHGGKARDTYVFWGPEGSAPYFMMSPTLGDVWLKATNNQALLLSYCYADRAALGMGGHGSFYTGNKKPWIYYLNAESGTVTTNSRHYEIPASAAGETLGAFAARQPEANEWMGHPLKRPKDYIPSPVLPRWEADHLARVLQAEAFGADEVTDLVYITLKSTDSTGHAYGQESLEIAEVLIEQDRQFKRLFDLLVKKVGRENLVVALTADHGGAPLPELSGGTRLLEIQLLGDLNRRFDRLDDGQPVAQFVSGTQLWFDENQLAAGGATLEDVKRYLESYQAEGRTFFEVLYTREELRSMQRLNLAPISRPGARP